MFAGHFAAGLALRGRARRVPLAAYIVGAFVLDLLWIAFGVMRLDRTPWQDWSHSLVMAALWAMAFAALFRNFGPKAFVAVWLAVFSHYVLDLIVQGASLYPGAPRSQLIPTFVGDHARLFQFVISGMLLLVFVRDEKVANALSLRTGLACGLVLSLNARFLLGL